jgi:hypothetical protein
MTNKLGKSPTSLAGTLLYSSPPNNAKASAAAPGRKPLVASKGSSCFLMAYLAFVGQAYGTVVGQRVSRGELDNRRGPPRAALQMVR